MAKLEAELDEAGLLQSERNPDPRPFTYDDISKLRYLDQVIKVRRTASPDALGLSRCQFRTLEWDKKAGAVTKERMWCWANSCCGIVPDGPAVCAASQAYH